MPPCRGCQVTPPVKRLLKIPFLSGDTANIKSSAARHWSWKALGSPASGTSTSRHWRSRSSSSAFSQPHFTGSTSNDETDDHSPTIPVLSWYAAKRQPERNYPDENEYFHDWRMSRGTTRTGYTDLQKNSICMGRNCLSLPSLLPLSLCSVLWNRCSFLFSYEFFRPLALGAQLTYPKYHSMSL